MTDELSADYRQAGFANRLGFGNAPALVVIDFCNAYLEPGSPLYAGVEDALASTERILEASRAAAIRRRMAKAPDGGNAHHADKTGRSRANLP